MRSVSTVFAVGQELPFMEVPAPNTRRGAAVQRDMVQLAIYRLFRQSHDVPPRLHMDDLRKYTLLPELTLRYCKLSLDRTIGIAPLLLLLVFCSKA